MSYTLDVLLNQASDGLATTVALSSTSVAVLLYATGFLEQKHLWLDRANFPGDEISDDDWQTILEIVSLLEYEVMTADVGAIIPYATASPPPNTLDCDGGTFLRVDFPLLYAVLDSAFIVDADTFVVPDLRSVFPVGKGTGSGLSTYAMNDAGGEETHTLVTSEMPSHSHTDTGHTHVEGTAAPAIGAAIVGVPIPSAVPSVGVTGSGSASLTNTGGDGAHENRPPFHAVGFAIRCQ